LIFYLVGFGNGVEQWAAIGFGQHEKKDSGSDAEASVDDWRQPRNLKKPIKSSCLVFELYRFPEFVNEWCADAPNSTDHGAKAKRVSANLSREDCSVNLNNGKRARNAKLSSKHQPPAITLSRE